MAEDVRPSGEEPVERLRRIANVMLEAMEAHPENPNDSVRAMVLLLEGDRGTVGSAGWDDPEEQLAALLQAAEALAKASGQPFAVMEMPGKPGGQG